MTNDGMTNEGMADGAAGAEGRGKGRELHGAEVLVGGKMERRRGSARSFFLLSRGGGGNEE